MTVYQQTIISLDEIGGLRFCCRHCHSVIACPPEQWLRLPESCPNCNAEWIRPAGAEIEALRLLCKSLSDSKNSQKNISCDVSLALTMRAKDQPVS